jgi:hypothetical protein
MELPHGEGIAGCNLGEADQRVHHGELSWVIELEPRDAFAIREARGFRELPQLAAVDEGLEDVLLDGEIAVGDGRHRCAKLRHGLDRFRDAEIGDIVRGGLGAQQQMVSDVLLDRAVAVVTSNDGIGQVEIFDDRFELPAMPFRDLPAEDGGEFRRLADGPIGVEEALPERVEGGPAVEDQVVAIFDLREKEPMLAGCLAPFGRCEEGREGAEPLLGAAGQVAGCECIGELLQPGRGAAGQERVAALPKRDPLSLQTIGEPVMLIEAHARRERKVGAHADKHAPPLAVEEIEVVLHDPPARVLQMPAVVFADGNQDARRLAGFQNDDDLIRIGAPEVAIDEVVPTPMRGRLDNRRAPVLRACGHPMLVLAGDVLQNPLADRIQLSVPVEEADDTLGLLKRLNQPVQQKAIEAAIGEPDTILVMLVEGVHGHLQVSATRQDKPMNAATSSR